MAGIEVIKASAGPAAEYWAEVRALHLVEQATRFAILGEPRAAPAPSLDDIAALVRVTQAMLRQLAGVRLVGAHRQRHSRAHWATVHALLQLLGRAEAKRRHVALSGGKPLAICIGHFESRFESVFGAFGQDWARRSYPFGDGCGLVFEDSLTGRARYPFRFYCRDCRRTRRARWRADGRRLRAYCEGREEVVIGFDERGIPMLAWSGQCVSCGATFPHHRPDARRCDRCRRSHR